MTDALVAGDLTGPAHRVPVRALAYPRISAEEWARYLPALPYRNPCA